MFSTSPNIFIILIDFRFFAGTFNSSDLTIRNKNLRTLRTVGLKSGIKEIVTAFNYDDTLFVLLVIVQLFHGDEDHVLCGELTSLLKLKAIWDVVRRSNIIFVSSILRVRKTLLKNFRDYLLHNLGGNLCSIKCVHMFNLLIFKC